MRHWKSPVRRAPRRVTLLGGIFYIGLSALARLAAVDPDRRRRAGFRMRPARTAAACPASVPCNRMHHAHISRSRQLGAPTITLAGADAFAAKPANSELGET